MEQAKRARLSLPAEGEVQLVSEAREALAELDCAARQARGVKRDANKASRLLSTLVLARRRRRDGGLERALREAADVLEVGGTEWLI